MKTLRPGHRYELENFEAKDQPGQILQFIEKMPAPPDTLTGLPAQPGHLVTCADGTTNEEVLKVLIDRMNSLQANFPCRENAIALTHIEEALMWLQRRTVERIKRGVEGAHEK